MSGTSAPAKGGSYGGSQCNRLAFIAEGLTA